MRADRSTILGFSAILLWSATVALARSISERVGPWSAGASVYLLAGIFLLVLDSLQHRSPRSARDLPPLYLFGCGGLFVAYTLALFAALDLAVDRLQAIEVGLVNYLWPALTLLFSVPLLGKKAGLLLAPGTLLALAGTVLVIRPGSPFSWGTFVANAGENPAAYGLALAAAVSWALYSNLTRRWGESARGGGVPLFALATGAAFALVRGFLPGRGEWNGRVVAEIALLAAGTALAYLFWDIAMRRGDLTLVASGSYLTPFLSTLVSSLYLGVLPGTGVWLGCLLIIGGSLLCWRSMAGAPPGAASPR